jgi:hypothetical protein
MVFSLLGRTVGRVAPRLASSLGSSTTRAAAAGVAGGTAGGVLLDDIPILGSLDPTEGSGGIGFVQIAILGFVAVAGMLTLSRLSGGS